MPKEPDERRERVVGMSGRGAIQSRRVLKTVFRPLEFWRWRGRNYESPAPFTVKMAVLMRHGMPSEVWVETGTYLGETTERLARRAKRVISLEPQVDLYEAARGRFRNRLNVQLINGSSEECFEDIVRELRGPVNFWLDGHASAGITFTGDVVTPILYELATIRSYRANFEDLVVFVDDWRLFGAADAEGAGYPSAVALTEWAEECGMQWTVEHDIFVASRRG